MAIPPSVSAAHPAPVSGVRWLHVCWGETSIELEQRWSDGKNLDRKPLGPLTSDQVKRIAALTTDCAAVILEIPAYPFQAIVFAHRNPLKNFLRLPFIAGLAWKYARLRRLLARSPKPVLIFDLQDSAGIAARFLPLFPLIRHYHKRELPKLPANAFLHTEPFGIEPWRNRGRYAKEIAQLRPLSLGAGFTALPARTREKDIDLFWAGTVDNSPLRSRGVALLRQLRDEGFRVTIVEHRLDKEEFYDHIARSWLTFCPDGNGWQCWRTFEVACLGSVPLLSYPIVWQDEPFRGGEHCFYYDPEGDDLKKVVRQALADLPQLRRMSESAREFTVTAHTQAAVYHRHVSALV